MGSDDQQLTDVLVAEPADPAQPLLAAGGSLPRHEAEPGRELPPTTEDVGVRHSGGDGSGNQRPDAWVVRWVEDRNFSQVDLDSVWAERAPELSRVFLSEDGRIEVIHARLAPPQHASTDY